MGIFHGRLRLGLSNGCVAQGRDACPLMHHLHGEAQRQGMRELTADVSKTAEPFFARHGFTVVERRFPERRGVVLENARMRKVVGNEPLPC